MPFNQRQMDAIRKLADSPYDCLLCGGRSSLAVVSRDLDRVEETGRLDLRCGKCGVKLTISA